MQAIWKYRLEPTDCQSIELPQGAKILCVQVQNEWPYIWVLNPDTDIAPTEARHFTIYGTGHIHEQIPGIYIGTFQMFKGKLVFHVFEIDAKQKPTASRKILWDKE